MDSISFPAELGGRATRSDARGLVQLTFHLVALGASGLFLYLSLGTLWSVPAFVLYGVVLVFLFAPEHECTHGTAFRSRGLNVAVRWLCGLVLLLPAGYFRYFHFAHHRYTQDRERDPELAVGKPRTRGEYVRAVAGAAYWYERLATILRHAGGRVSEDFIPTSARRRIAWEARAVLACYALIAMLAVGFESWAPVVFWVVPALVGQPALRLYLLAEHTGRPFAPDMLVNTRTTETNPLLQRLAWNMPYHAEHHAAPAVPFHALPTLHRAIGAKVEETAPGYLAVHRELLRSLRS